MDRSLWSHTGSIDSSGRADGFTIQTKGFKGNLTEIKYNEISKSSLLPNSRRKNRRIGISPPSLFLSCEASPCSLLDK